MSATRATGRVRRMTTETKQAFKTTEFWVYVVLLIALFIAGAVTGGDGTTAAGEAAGDPSDDLDAGRTWLYAIILTVGYLLSRGLSKAGSSDPYWDDPNAGDGDGIGDRVKQAAQVLTEGSTGAEQPTQRQSGTQYR